MDPTNGGPTDALTAEAIQLISALGSSATTVSQVIDNKDEAVYSAVQKGIDAANEHAISHAQKVLYEYLLINIALIFIYTCRSRNSSFLGMILVSLEVN